MTSYQSIASRLGSSALFGVLLAGCFPEQVEGCGEYGSPDEPTIFIGSAEGDLETSAESGGPFTIEYGSQGGQHIYVSFRVFGVKEGDTLVTLPSEGPNGGDPAELSNTIVPETLCEGSEWLEIENVRVLLPGYRERTEFSVELRRCPEGEAGCAEPEVIANKTVTVDVIES